MHLLRDGTLEKRLARYGVVAIIFERIVDGLRRDRRTGEVKDAADFVGSNERRKLVPEREPCRNADPIALLDAFLAYRQSRRQGHQRLAYVLVRNLEFIVMPSRGGERACGAGFSRESLGIIKARSGTEAVRHRPGTVWVFDRRAPLFRAPSL
jgi:hypothetical protein